MNVMQAAVWLIPLIINISLVVFLSSKKMSALKVWDPGLDPTNTPQHNTRLILLLMICPLLNIIFMVICMEYIYIRFTKEQK